MVATKKELDAKVDAIRKEAKELEVKMRQKASLIGNIVGDNVPVSQTEVCAPSVQVFTNLNMRRTKMRHSGRGIRLRKRTSPL